MQFTSVRLPALHVGAYEGRFLTWNWYKKLGFVRLALRAAQWRVAQPSDGKPHSGCPILRVLFAKGGWQTDRTMGFAFHAACARNEIFPQPSFTRTGPDSSRRQKR